MIQTVNNLIAQAEVLVTAVIAVMALVFVAVTWARTRSAVRPSARCRWARLWSGEGMREILGRYPQIDVVGAGASVGDHFELLAALQPHLVLVDEPATKAAETVAAVRRAASEARVVVVAVNDDDQDVIAWAEAGVSGYVTRDESLDTLVAVIRAVGRDELLCSPRLAATLLRQVARSATHSNAGRVDQRLTAREREVLALVEHGLSNKQIAYRLSIALPTVKNHVHNILGKLEARGRCEAIATLHGLQQVPG